MDSSLDILWVLICSSLVFLMQAGFLCLEVGATRRKNSINVALKNIADLGLSILLFWAIGYGIMFGDSFHGWLGYDQFFPDLGQANGWPVTLFLFEAVFCSTAVTIVSGAVAERMSFIGYILLTILTSGFIYPIFGHWAWYGLIPHQQTASMGWLASRGFVDFAGSTVVHSLGGWVALATVLVIGPRLGRFSKKRSLKTVASTDIRFTLLGMLILWFGWFGFNGGSTLAFNQQIPGILVNTLLAGAAGIVAPLFWMLASGRKVSGTLIINGALAGLVSITAGCHAVSSSSAVLIGIGGSIVVVAIDALLEHYKIDDTVGAIPVHLGGGIWGTIAIALFGNLDRLGSDLDRTVLIKTQISGILACGVWTFTVSLVVLFILKKMVTLRVTQKQEYIGLNIHEHASVSEFYDLYSVMKNHAKTGNLRLRANANSFTEIGQISHWYNQVVQSLEQAFARLDAVINTALDSIITVEPDSLLLKTVNPATETIFGFPSAQLIGKSLLTILETAQNDRISAQSELQHLLTRGCYTGEILEAVGVNRQEERFSVELTVTLSAIGTEHFWTIMARDISERKAAEAALQMSEAAAHDKAEQLNVAIQELQQAQTQLLQGEKMASLGHLVAGLAHEINNPVSFIHGNLQYLDNSLEDLLFALECYQNILAQNCYQYPSDVQEKLSDLDLEFLKQDCPQLILSMKNGSERIRDIVRSLRNFVHYDEAEYKKIDIHMGIENTLVMLSHLLRQHKPSIQIERKYGELPKVWCYAGAINQVFFNILNNAIAAISLRDQVCELGKITITTEATEGTVRIIIADNGIGVPDAAQSKVFDPFFTTKSVGQGTGMGLAISHQIVVDQHKGQLQCQSVAGQGAKFTINLPCS